MPAAGVVALGVAATGVLVVGVSAVQAARPRKVRRFPEFPVVTWGDFSEVRGVFFNNFFYIWQILEIFTRERVLKNNAGRFF